MKTDPNLRCPVCSGPLYPPGHVRLAGDFRVYCSNACRQKNHRDKNKRAA